MTDYSQLAETIDVMAAPGKGILAADESFGTIAKRFQAIDVESTEENRRSYRSLLVTTSGVEAFIGGVIFFEETLTQRTDDGRTMPEVCASAGIMPGIKVDKGAVALAGAPGDKITEGLDGLASRLATYREQGARFTKWRNVYTIGRHQPSAVAVAANAEVMARYAASVQEAGMVPIVEPEVLMDGAHDVARCAEVTESVQRAVFDALYRHGVRLEYMVLKPNMVLPGKEQERLAPEAVAEHTLALLRRTVPAAVPAIAFLSGGQTPAEATANLNAINAAEGLKPWALTFSYGRALQEPAQQAWRGLEENSAAAKEAFYERARLNGAARRGTYLPDMETA